MPTRLLAEHISLSEIEASLIPFRTGRRLVLEKLLTHITQVGSGPNVFITISRMFARLKSADSILEKINRKGINISAVAEIPQKIRDILGVRIIAESHSELKSFDRFLTKEFRVVSRTDQLTQPGEFGQRGLEYELVYLAGKESFPFELQLRTFFQHLWHLKSFHLFHKQAREYALPYADDLRALGEMLKTAEDAAERLREKKARGSSCASARGALDLTSKVHLMVIGPREEFLDHVTVDLDGEDNPDHEKILSAKLRLYSIYQGAAIVECSCVNLLTYLFNEPQVHIAVGRIGKTTL